MKKIAVDIKFNFEFGKLNIAARANVACVPLFIELGDPIPSVIKIFRYYPLTELEARSLKFTKSNPMLWVENHVLDLLRLEGFNRAYDMRDVLFEVNYVDGWHQTERPDYDGAPAVPENHIYRWSHDRTNNVVVLTDNGVAIIRANVRGPQSYTWLGEEVELVRNRAFDAQESAQESESEVGADQ